MYLHLLENRKIVSKLCNLYCPVLSRLLVAKLKICHIKSARQNLKAMYFIMYMVDAFLCVGVNKSMCKWINWLLGLINYHVLMFISIISHIVISSEAMVKIHFSSLRWKKWLRQAPADTRSWSCAPVDHRISLGVKKSINPIGLRVWHLIFPCPLGNVLNLSPNHSGCWTGGQIPTLTLWVYELSPLNLLSFVKGE